MKHIEVIYAYNEKSQKCIALTITEKTTALSAIQQSGILDLHPEIDLNQNAIGLYGKIISLDTLVDDGDRIEIYRPLDTSAIEKRRLRVQKETNS